MIVSTLRDRRLARGWSQSDLADRSGLSRPAVSAIEIGRIVPSVAAAMALAKAFDCRVEDLFGQGSQLADSAPRWAWASPSPGGAFWTAALGEQIVRYPFEPTLAGILPADGFQRGERVESHPAGDPERTLVIAACDPSIGLLAAELRRTASIRVVPLIRSSRAALELLRKGLVHVAGIHLQDPEHPDGNRFTARQMLGSGYSLLRVSRWQEGLALQPGLRIRSVRQALQSKLRWVGREEGSGARRCLDAILGRRPRPLGYDRIARHHGGVAETIRTGWAEAGVCVRFVAESAGLTFLDVQEEDHDFCYRTEKEDEPRIEALLRVVRSRSFRKSLAELAGYDSSQTGALQRIAE